MWVEEARAIIADEIKSAGIEKERLRETLDHRDYPVH